MSRLSSAATNCTLANFPQRDYPQAMNWKLAIVALVTLVWSCLAFCGEIHDAAQKGDLEKVKALLKDNAELVFSKDDDGNTPLHSAVKFDHKDVAEFLLANKAEVDARDKWNDWTSLHIAAVDGYKDEAELLLAHKADVNAKGKWNITPLYLAAGSGHKEVVELLLANKADVNVRDSYEGMTPLHCAAAFGHKNVAELLLTNNADVNATNKVGNTPLRLAEMEQAKVKTKKPVSPNGEKDLIDVAEFLRQHGGHE